MSFTKREGKGAYVCPPFFKHYRLTTLPTQLLLSHSISDQDRFLAPFWFLFGLCTGCKMTLPVLSPPWECCPGGCWQHLGVGCLAAGSSAGHRPCFWTRVSSPSLDLCSVEVSRTTQPWRRLLPGPVFLCYSPLREMGVSILRYALIFQRDLHKVNQCKAWRCWRGAECSCRNLTLRTSLQVWHPPVVCQTVMCTSTACPARTGWFWSQVVFREEHLSVKTVVKVRFYRSLIKGGWSVVFF